uniref:N-acetyltransferase domain-containing protein n=1 Tax=Steinernema glaseri TaxID=37863 RepID=A0A1I8A6I8_9BILA
MTSIRPFEPADIFKFGPMYIHMGNKSNAVELLLKYYFTYPDYCIVAAHHTGEIMGYAAGSERQDPLLRIPVKLFAYLGTFSGIAHTCASSFIMTAHAYFVSNKGWDMCAEIYWKISSLGMADMSMVSVRVNSHDYMIQMVVSEMTKWFPEVTLQDWYITAERLAGQYGQDALEHARQQLALQQINQGGQGNGQNR